MKKAKIMLVVIAILAVVGGSFAFKTTRTARVFYRMNAAGNACTVPVTLFYTTTSVGGTILTNYWAFSGPTTFCQVRVTTSF